MTATVRSAVAAMLLLTPITACGGGFNTPNGPVVGSPGGPTQTPTPLVNVHVTIAISTGQRPARVRPNYVSPNTQSVVIQLSSVDDGGVTGVNATTIDTRPGAKNCSVQGRETICTATAFGSPGNDVFSVTTYASMNATGPILSAGTAQAKISSDSSLRIDNRLPLTLNGVIASLTLSLSPNAAKRGKAQTSAVTLQAFDATDAQIIGASDYAAPISLTIQGDTQNAFRLHSGTRSGSSLTIVRPTSGIRLTYDGNTQASTITVQASVNGPSSVSAHARFTLRGKQPPPPVGTIYALNFGNNDGRSATVTEYDGKAKGNAAPVRSLQLSAKLYARSIAVDSTGNLYVGFFDNTFGFQVSSGKPDLGNVIYIYAPGASGNTPPTAVLTADKKTNTALFPLFIRFDPSGDLVTYGATSVDGNTGDAVLTYAPESSGPTAPAHGWDFASPSINYAGPTGLALDSAGNFYFNGALHSTLGPTYGVFVAPHADLGNPQTNPSRTIPWDAKTELTPGVTTNVDLDESGEIFVANSLVAGGSSSPTCQGRANVFAAGADGGITDVPPLRVLVLGGVFTKNSQCSSSRSPLAPFFPTTALYGTTLFTGDDFNNAIRAYPASANGKIQPTLTIAGPATKLDAPVALVITKLSGRAMAGPANQDSDPLHAQ